MSALSRRHTTFKNGWAPCSVPMWSDGCPAGFCDRIAYGIQTREYRDRFAGVNPQIARPAYAPGFACYIHGGPAEHRELKVFQYEGSWCAVRRHGFTDILECRAVFATTPEQAIDLFYEQDETDETPCPRCDAPRSNEPPDGCRDPACSALRTCVTDLIAPWKDYRRDDLMKRHGERLANAVEAGKRLVGEGSND